MKGRNFCNFFLRMSNNFRQYVQECTEATKNIIFTYTHLYQYTHIMSVYRQSLYSVSHAHPSARHVQLHSRFVRWIERRISLDEISYWNSNHQSNFLCRFFLKMTGIKARKLRTDSESSCVHDNIEPLVSCCSVVPAWMVRMEAGATPGKEQLINNKQFISNELSYFYVYILTGMFKHMYICIHTLKHAWIYMHNL